MNYFLIAGEASGDMHAADLMARIRLRDTHAHYTGLGGDRMAAAGCHLHQHIRHMAFMGFAAVLANMGQVRRNFRIAKEALLADRPDVLILVDYPSFNLRMAAFCRRYLPQTKIYYYIPPKVWAWKKRRIHRIARLCDEVFGIFPFEPAFYAQYGYSCTYVGHPTVEGIDRFAQSQKTAPLKDKGQKMIAVLPGSRPSEIRHCLPRMLEAAHRMANCTVTVCAAPGIDDAFYTPYLSARDTLTRATYETLQQASAAVVNSGTATLEAALIGCPQVAVYHLACSRLMRGTRRVLQPLFFSIPYFTPVNIIAGEQIIRECIADAFTVENVTDELQRILYDAAYQKKMLAAYEHLSSLLGSQSAAATAAARITS